MDGPSFDRRSLLKGTGALAGASVLGLLGTGPAAAEELETSTGKTTPQFEAAEPQEFYIDVEMTFENADGEEVTETPTLYGEIIRPTEDGEAVDDVPVILTYTPYGDLYQALGATSDPTNALGSPADDGIADYFVPRGYARAMFDVIGCRNSDGYYDYGGIRERLSGRDLVNGLGELEWTNGNVGMIGGSYDGTTQIAAAIEAPEHLAAIIPQVAIDRWYDYRHFGGVPRSTVGTPTLFDFGLAAVPPRAGDPVQNVEVTATRVQPHRRVEYEQRSYEYDSVYDEFWVERDYRRRAENIDCAVMIEGGWEDRNVIRWGSTRLYETLEAAGHERKRLVMGDWAHSAGQHPDSQALYHGFYDRWLLDGDEAWHDLENTDTGIMELPPVDSQSASSTRTQFEQWPPAGTETREFPLVATAGGTRELGLVGTDDPTWQDSREELAESDMFGERGSGDRYLMFETEPFGDDLRIGGHITADLLAESSADTWYVAVVYERSDDGSTRVFSRGAWNSRFREGEATESATPTGEPYRVGVEAWDIDWTVSEGSRLGLVVASDNSDYVRNDPTNESTNALQFGESVLRVDAFYEGFDESQYPSGRPPEDALTGSESGSDAGAGVSRSDLL